MAQLKTAPISAKTYRHFAIVTVAITLTLAVFADGENRQALSDQVAEGQQRALLQREGLATLGEAKVIPREARRLSEWGYGGYGDSFDSDYGKPSDGSYSGGASTARKGRARPNAKVPGSYAPYGISQAQWQAMSEEEREELLRQRTAAQPTVSAEQHRREVEGLLAASAARAGGASED